MNAAHKLKYQELKDLWTKCIIKFVSGINVLPPCIRGFIVILFTNASYLLISISDDIVIVHGHSADLNNYNFQTEESNSAKTSTQ